MTEPDDLFADERTKASAAYAQPDRLERLMTLVMYFRTRDDNEPVLLRRLIDDFPLYGGASGRRRFEDDKKALAAAGVPLTMTYPEGAGGAAGYRIDETEYYLPELELTDEERVAFALATSSVDLQSVVWAQLAGTKLGTTSRPGSTVTHLPVHSLLPELVDAVRAHTRLQITYRATDRSIDPYGVVLKRGRWYVVAHCHHRGFVIPFRVDRIDPASVQTVASDAFTTPDGFVATEHVPDDPKLMGADDAVIARVRIDAGIAVLVLAELDGSGELEPETSENDSTATATRVVRLPVAHREAFRSWVLALGERAEVLEPPELRAEVMTWLQALAPPEVRA